MTATDMTDRAGQDEDRVPIVVIGGGPVGMMLALQLDALGVRCAIVNTEPKPRWHPKGGTHNSRTMEHYRRLGLSGAIRKLGLPSDHPTDVVYMTRLNGWELQRLPMPSENEKARAVREAGPVDQVLEPLLRCNQMQVEALLFEALGKKPNIVSYFGWHARSFTDHADGVSVEVENTETGKTRTLRALYVAGCDAAQGLTRRALGIRYQGDTPEKQAYLGGPMVSSHLRAPALRARLRTKAWQYWTVNRDLRCNMLSIDGDSEFLFNTRLKTGEETPDDGVISRAFLGSVGETIPFELVGHSTWTAGQALVADRFGQGRVLLAGDAVHLFTPTGGFGMNTGVDDSANLAWKLAALAQGWGGPKLAESYEIERKPIALRNTGAAKRLARNVGAVPVGDAIEEDTPEGEAQRQAAREFLASFGQEFGSLGVQLGARYDASPIIVGDGEEPPPDDPIDYVPSSVPGARAPHLWLKDRSSLFDRLGRGFTLLRFSEAASADPLVKAASRRGVPLSVLTIDHPEGRALYGRDLALIRPDQHVAWRGDKLPDDCGALLAHVTGW